MWQIFAKGKWGNTSAALAARESGHRYVPEMAFVVGAGELTKEIINDFLGSQSRPRESLPVASSEGHNHSGPGNQP